MDDKIIKAVLFYTFVTFFAIAICWVLMATLEWPLLAEIPLSVSLFIHILALSKELYELWTKFNIQFEGNIQLITEGVREAEDSAHDILDS